VDKEKASGEVQQEDQDQEESEEAVGQLKQRLGFLPKPATPTGPGAVDGPGH
jgi:hypothetical protein